MVNIYVGNLPFTTTEADLQQLFSQFGQVGKASIITDRETGRSRGFGFVEMLDQAESQRAIEALNGTDLGGRPLTVNEARPRTGGPGGPGGGGGGRGGYSGGGFRGRRDG